MFAEAVPRFLVVPECLLVVPLIQKVAAQVAVTQAIALFFDAFFIAFGSPQMHKLYRTVMAKKESGEKTDIQRHPPLTCAKNCQEHVFRLSGDRTRLSTAGIVSSRG